MQDSATTPFRTRSPHHPAERVTVETLTEWWTAASQRAFVAEHTGTAVDVDDHWTVLALGTRIAAEVTNSRWVMVAQLLRAGAIADWHQAGDALGMTESEARSGFAAWITGQVNLFHSTGLGITDVEAVELRDLADSSRFFTSEAEATEWMAARWPDDDVTALVRPPARRCRRERGRPRAVVGRHPLRRTGRAGVRPHLICPTPTDTTRTDAMSLLDTLNGYHGHRLGVAALLLICAALLVIVTTPLAVAAVLGDRAVSGLNAAARRVPTGPEPTCLRRHPTTTTV
jgi:hypothetical protein